MVAGAGQVAAVRAAPLVGVAAGTAGKTAATAAGADGVHRRDRRATEREDEGKEESGSHRTAFLHTK